MTDKSHVSIGQHQCPVCGTIFDSGEILLQKKFKSRDMEGELDPKTVTDYELCPEHAKLHEEGYIALVGGIQPSDKDTFKIHEVERTGLVAHVKRDMVQEVIPSMTDEHVALPLIFVEDGVIEKLKDLAGV